MNAMQHVHRTACAVLGGNDCYYTVQRPIRNDRGTEELRLPAVVIRAIGQDALTTLSEGAHQTATIVRVEARARTYAAVLTLSDRLVAAMREGGRLVSLLSLIDDYDEPLGIHRRIRSVMVR